VLGLELLGGLLVVVDEAESGGASSSEGSLEAEKDHTGRLGLVGGSNGLLELRTGDVSLSGVDDLNDHLPPGEEGVADELPSADSNRVGHDLGKTEARERGREKGGVSNAREAGVER